MSEQTIKKTILIDAPVADVWKALTEPELMKQWMSPDSPIEINTDWQAGSNMIMHGPWYKTHFENTGKVLVYQPMQAVAYTHLSSLSRLADEPGNYAVIDFRLSPAGHRICVELTISNFATDAIYHHLAFYWNVALHLLKKTAEH